MINVPWIKDTLGKKTEFPKYNTNTIPYQGTGILKQYENANVNKRLDKEMKSVHWGCLPNA